MIKRLWAIICFFRGHDFIPTGRNLSILYQAKCADCGLLVCGHRPDGTYLKWDKSFEAYFNEREAT